MSSRGSDTTAMRHHAVSPTPSTSELRKFGLLVGGAFMLLGVVAFLRHKPIALSGALAALGGALTTFGAVAPASLAAFYRGWMRLALMLSTLTTPLFMAVMYFGVLWPTGFVMRLFRKHSTDGSGTATFWVSRPPGERASVLERPF